jgi:peptidoglycan hydrolase CwlO-like protein
LPRTAITLTEVFMAIKVKVKHRGAYLTVNGESQEIEVGKLLEFDGDELPSFLVGKAEIVGDTDGKELVVSDELLEAASEENKALSAKVDSLTADLDAASEKLAAYVTRIEELEAELKKAQTKGR